MFLFFGLFAELQVAEAQVLVGGVFACSAESAVSLLWGLAVADGLMLELWDAMAVALDKPDVGLQQQQLQQVRFASEAVLKSVCRQA
jgi:hypothetical protein